MDGIGDDMAMRRYHQRVAEPTLPAIRLGDGAGQVSWHDGSPDIGDAVAQAVMPPRKRASSTPQPLDLISTSLEYWIARSGRATALSLSWHTAGVHTAPAFCA